MPIEIRIDVIPGGVESARQQIGMIRTGDGLRAERFLNERRLPLREAVEQYRREKAERGEQGFLIEEFRPKRRVRHCNPFGCRSEEMDYDDEAGGVTVAPCGR